MQATLQRKTSGLSRSATKELKELLHPSHPAPHPSSVPALQRSGTSVSLGSHERRAAGGLASSDRLQRVGSGLPSSDRLPFVGEEDDTGGYAVAAELSLTNSIFGFDGGDLGQIMNVRRKPARYGTGTFDAEPMTRKHFSRWGGAVVEHHLSRNSSVPSDDAAGSRNPARRGTANTAAFNPGDFLGTDEGSLNTLATRRLGYVALLDEFNGRALTGTIIGIDLLCLGYEADKPAQYWGAVECIFVMYYLVEMSIRLQQHGAAALLSPFGKRRDLWPGILLNHYRLGIVVVALLGAVAWAAGATWLRPSFLYWRLLRTLRFFNLSDVLTRFVVAMLEMMRNLVWIFGVIGLASYVASVYFTVYTAEHEYEKAQESFPNVWQGTYNLFQVTTMDNWMSVAGPMVERQGAWAIFFVMFIAFSSWVMISLLTATVSERIIRATKSDELDEDRAEEQNLIEFARFLKDAFTEFDTDGNGVLDKDEFLTMIQEEVVTQKMEELGVMISIDELRETFDMLDVDESGALNIDEFTGGLTQLQQNVSIKQVLSINYSLERFYRKLQKQVNSEIESTELQLVLLCGKLERLVNAAVTDNELQARLVKLDERIDALLDMAGSTMSPTSTARSVKKAWI